MQWSQQYRTEYYTGSTSKYKLLGSFFDSSKGIKLKIYLFNQIDDPYVLECRDSLKNLQFGWMTFHPQKDKFCPAFAHPPDLEGIRKAQKITANGCISKTKVKFFDFSECPPEEQKEKAEVAALKKFNKKFYFSFK